MQLSNDFLFSYRSLILIQRCPEVKLKPKGANRTALDHELFALSKEIISKISASTILGFNE